MNARLETSGLGDLYRRIYRGVNYRLRTIVRGRLASNCRPADIGFMMTNLCNARCVHCDIWKNKGRDSTPTPEQYKATLSELRAWLGPVHVFFSGGEALLNPHTSDLLAYATSIGLYTEILTHGHWDDQTGIQKVALSNPGRVTVSLDGIGEAHTLIRGRQKFYEKTTRTLNTLCQIRAEKNFQFDIRLKTVVMEQNLHDVDNVARFAALHGIEVFYQAIEQNYNTPEDPFWFERSENWPKDPARAVSAVRRLIALKKANFPIRNSYQQLESMIQYFLNPAAMRVAVQSHTAHLQHPVCSALTNIQILPNGDVLACYGMPPIGNIKTGSIREIWSGRPGWWSGGCCMERRCTPTEKKALGLRTITPAREHQLK